MNVELLRKFSILTCVLFFLGFNVKVYNMIKTIFFFTYVGLSMFILIPYGLVATIFYFLGLKKLMTEAVYRVAQVWARSVIFVAGCKVTVVGRENILKKGSVCFVSNHCGYFDIPIILGYTGRPFGFVAKKELLLIPILNCWIFMLGGLFIDRSSPKKAVSTINKGVEKIKKGGGMLIFPEGHRSKGRGLLPFHPGSLKLATMAEVPIIPVAIDGSYDVFEKTNRIVSTSAKITFCEPIITADLPPEDRKLILCNRIYSVIKDTLEDSGSSE
jgi:1-acyl-sn-glycerol-3-phosphate acyltransferase